MSAGVGWDARRAGGGSGTTRTVQITESSELRVTTVAPGAVRVTVNGTLVGLVESWDWPPLQATVTLTLTSLRAAGVPTYNGVVTDDGIVTTDAEGIDVTVTAERCTVPGWTAEVR